MTNEEITVKYYTPIKNIDAADRTREPWGCGVCHQAPHPLGKELG